MIVEGSSADCPLPLSSTVLDGIRRNFVTDSGTHIFSQGCTWGVAYQVQGEQVSEALKYLNVREAVLGGYDTKEVTFYPQDTPDQPLKALAYVATPQNPGYLGPAPEEAIATQILACRGFSGHNLEYLLRLADFMQLCGPQAQDEHLAAIVDAVGTMLPCFCPTEQALALV